MTRWILAGVLSLTLAGVAQAADLAVIVANEDYKTVRDAQTDVDTGAIRDALEAARFEVETIRNVTARQLQKRLFDLRTDMEAADRLIVLVAGHVVTNGRDSWLLGTDAGRVSVFDAGAEGLPLSVLDPFLAEKPGSAMLLVASPGTQSGGTGLELGYLRGDVPQGVTILAGQGAALTKLLTDDILEAAMPVGQALDERSDGGIVGYGFLPRLVSFVPADTEDRTEAEKAAWDAAESGDTEAGYVSYLGRFPRGAHAGDARARLDILRMSPEARAAAAEEELGLDRDTRREVQRNLTLLGYDTRGIDGIFGRGTRAALRDWQDDEGIEATGYLTGNQVALLQELGGTRQAALEAEAKARQEEADRKDTAFWRQTGSGATEDGLRRYLADYPDGLFSDQARARIAEIESDRRAAASANDRKTWEEAQADDTIAGYERYMSIYPDGAFAGEAQARLEALNAQSAQDIAERDAAQADEARILANPITRLLVERRLNQLGLKPGEPDGNFDDATRKAIRNFQRARELPVTGYVNQATLVRLLAG